MKDYLLNRPWLSLPLLVVLAVGLFFGASALMTTGDTQQPGELSRRNQRRVEAARDTALALAARDSVHAARAAKSASQHYQQGQVYQDSVTYYQQHEGPIAIPATDTARIQRLWSEIFK